jgi:hypothetical protein
MHEIYKYTEMENLNSDDFDRYHKNEKKVKRD